MKLNYKMFDVQLLIISSLKCCCDIKRFAKRFVLGLGLVKV